MNNNKKYVNFMFLLAAGILWFISKHYVEFLVGRFQLARTMGAGSDVLLHGLPILIGVAVFIILRSNSTVYNFCTDSIGELVKVHWPSSKEVRLGTIVVILTVILAGIFLGLLDMGINAVIKAILGA